MDSSLIIVFLSSFVLSLTFFSIYSAFSSSGEDLKDPFEDS